MVEINTLAPVVLFVYNRPWHTEQTVEALKNNDLASESKLFIFADGPKKENDENVLKVRNYIKNIEGFKPVTIIEREKNLGLANSVIAGVTEIINKYGKVIVLEDDIVTAPNYLQYMNKALYKYKNNQEMFSISGYNVPMSIPENYGKDVFLTYRYSSWGWGTWIDRWNEADWDVQGWQQVFNDKDVNKKFRRGGDDLPYILKAQMNGTLNSWAIRWYYSHFSKDRFTVFPVRSLVENIGFDGTGVHCGNAENSVSQPLIEKSTTSLNLPESLEFNNKINSIFKGNFKFTFKDKIRRFLKELFRYKLGGI